METYNFTMKLGRTRIPLVAHVEGTNVIDIEVDDAHEAGLNMDGMLEMFTLIRRPGPGGERREHDARMVSSKWDHREGTLVFKMETSDYHMKIRHLATAAARRYLHDRHPEVDGLDKGVIRDAIRDL